MTWTAAAAGTWDAATSLQKQNATAAKAGTGDAATSGEGLIAAAATAGQNDAATSQNLWEGICATPVAAHLLTCGSLGRPGLSVAWNSCLPASPFYEPTKKPIG